MAKVISPFYGLGASGALANAIVFSSWKGIGYVRKYVIPANPNSGAQQAQRARLTAAVSDWHNIGLVAEDKVSYDRWALYGGKAMSGFNKFVERYIVVKKAGLVWSDPKELAATTITAVSLLLYVKQSVDDATMTVAVQWGTDQGYMPWSYYPAWNAVTLRYEVNITGLTSKVIYYARVKMSKAGQDGYIGNLRVQTI